MRAAWLLFRTLGVGYLRTHRVRVGLSALGVALGVMLMLATLILDLSLPSSFAESQRDLQGTAQIEVTGNGTGGLRSAVADAVKATPGVAASASLLVVGAQLRGPRGIVQVIAFGFDHDALAKLAPRVASSSSVRKVRRQPGLVLPQRLLDRLGQFPDATLALWYEGRRTPLPVSAIVSDDLGAHLNGGRFVGLPLLLAQRIFAQPGRLSSVLVETKDPSPAAVTRLRRRLADALGTGVIVQPVSEEQRELEHSVAIIQTYSTFVSVAALLIGAYLIFNTMSVAAVERRREASILHAVGEPRGQIVVRLLGEAGAIGLAGTLAGLAAGCALGWYLVQATPRYLEDAYGFTPVASISPGAVLAAGLAGVATAVLAAALPARGFLRVQPAEALQPQPLGETAIDARLQVIAFVAGLALAGAGFVGGLLDRTQGAVLLVPVFAGFVLMAPALFVASTRLAAVALMRWRAPGAGLTQLAGINLVHGPRRVVAMLSATAFSLALIVAVGGSLASLQDLTDRYADHYRQFDLYVAATDDAYALVPMDQSVLAAVRALPEVQAAYASRDTFVTWRGERVLLIGQDPAILRRLGLPLQAGDVDGALGSLGGDGMLVSTQLAAVQHLAVGDRTDVQTPRGPQSFRVAGIVEHLAWPDGTMIIGEGRYVDDFRQQDVNQVLVRLQPGAAPGPVRSAVEARVPGAAVQTAADLVDGIRQEQSSALAPFLQVRVVAVVVAVATVFNGMLIAVLQRLRDVGIQRALGVLGSEVAAALVIEVVSVLAIALLAGVVLGSLMQALGTQLVAAAAGLPLRWTFAAGPVLQGVAAAAAAALVGSLYPAHRAAAVPVLDAIAYE